MIEAEKFAEILRQYRKSHYMTQKQMADLIGVSTNHISTLEKGKKRPRASTIAAFETAVKNRDWYPAGTLAMMEESEMQVYDQIWNGLRKMDAEREQEVLEIFFRIVDWL